MLKLIGAVAALVVVSAPVLAQDGDPAKGEKGFRMCKACHAVGEGAQNKIGPELNGIIGREPGHLDGYQYSPAMKTFGEGKVWDAKLLDEFLAAPRTVVKGTKMAFPGVRQEKARADLVAYLSQFKEDGSIGGN